MRNLILGNFVLENLNYSTLPEWPFRPAQVLVNRRFSVFMITGPARVKSESRHWQNIEKACPECGRRARSGCGLFFETPSGQDRTGLFEHPAWPANDRKIIDADRLSDEL